MARVRGERVDMPAVAVQRQCGEGVFAHPEVPLEAVAQIGGGLFQERRVDLVVPDRAGQVRGAAQRVVRVALRARRHHRTGGAAAVGRTDRAGGVLPVLVGEASAVRAVHEIAARGQPAVVQHPADRRTGVGFEAAGQGHVAGLLRVGAEQHQEQRRRVHRTVVAPVRHLPEVRQLAVPHLVHDLAGLGDRAQPHLDRLGGGQRGQGGGGQLGPVGQREERGEQRVAAQQGEEPGDPGRRDPQFLAVQARRRRPGAPRDRTDRARRPRPARASRSGRALLARTRPPGRGAARWPRRGRRARVARAPRRADAPRPAAPAPPSRAVPGRGSTRGGARPCRSPPPRPARARR